jgi:hypothetical protein
MRRGWIALFGVLLLLVAVFGAAVVWSQPLVNGSVSAHDEHLFIDSRPMSSESGVETPIFEYEYRANTSYYTVFSVRNQGPLPVTIIGLDPYVKSMNSSVGPADLLAESSNDDPYGTLGAGSATKLDPTIVKPGAELNLWIRWRIGACGPDGTPHFGANSGVALSSIPLSWSVLGFPRTSTFDLPYVVAFQVTQDRVSTECVPDTGPIGALTDR